MFSEFKYTLLIVTFGLAVAVPLQHMLRKIAAGEVSRRARPASPEQAAALMGAPFFGPSFAMAIHLHRVPPAGLPVIAIGALGSGYALFRYRRAPIDLASMRPARRR